jgi:hypothetical protein
MKETTMSEQTTVVTATRSFKVGVKTRGDAEWACNGLRFKTEEEARAYGDDLFMRWTAVTEWTVLPSDDEPNR